MPKIENAYKNWKSKDLQYFWKKLDIKRVEYDHRYNEEASVDAISRGRAGDQRVVAYLRGLANDAKWGAEATKGVGMLACGEVLAPRPARGKRN